MFSPARLRRVAVFIFALLIAFGVGCRFYNLNWDEGAHLHPDERFLTMTVPELKWPSSPANYLNTNKSGLNPFNSKVDFFVYGQLPLTLAKAVAVPLNADNYDGILRVGRFLSALFDAATLLLIFLIGRRVGSTMLGLFAAALLALIPLHVQQSHFFTVDNFATFFVVACAWALCDGASRKKQVLAGFCFGAAAACKISSLLFGAFILLWLIASFRRDWKSLLSAALIIFGIAFITFRLFHPIAFRGEGGFATLWGFLDLRPAEIRWRPNGKAFSFWLSFAEQAAISRGDIDPPWNWQWFGRQAYLWPLRNLGAWALGWPLLIAGACGIVFGAAKFKNSIVNRGTPWVESSIVNLSAVWCLLVFLYYGGQYSKFTRYYLVMTPFLALLSAWFLLGFARRFRHKPLPLLVAAWVPLNGFLWCLAVTSIYTRPHTRMEASRWIWANVPAGTKVAKETPWDDGLPIGDVRGLEVLDLDLFNHDTREKREHLLDVLDKSEWIFISSNRVWGTVPLAPQRWPLTNSYYALLFFNELGFKLEREFTSYPQLFGVEFPDDNVEEALTVYDHPHVMLYRKAPGWSRRYAARLLDEKLCDQADMRPLREWLGRK